MKKSKITAVLLSFVLLIIGIPAVPAQAEETVNSQGTATELSVLSTAMSNKNKIKLDSLFF